MEYKCSICGEVFDNIADLIDHLSGHQEEEDQKYYMTEDLDIIKEKISDVEYEIDAFNEKYSNLMNITYNFNFVEHGKKTTTSKESSDKTCEKSVENKSENKSKSNETNEFVNILNEFINEISNEKTKTKTKTDTNYNNKTDISFVDFLNMLFDENFNENKD